MATGYIWPFSHSQCYKDFVNILEDVSIAYLLENVIACGDFNLPGVTWSDNLSANAVQYVAPAILENVNVLRQLALLLNWRQLLPLHSSKGYTLDLLFASCDTCVYNSIDEDTMTVPSSKL